MRCEQKLSNRVLDFHRKAVSDLNLPKWTHETPCPFCQTTLGFSSIRGITFKTNARNIGDICLDFVCSSCKKGDFLYFRKAFSSSSDISAILLGEKEVPNEPILEDQMYSLQYNNVMDMMHKNGEI